MGRAAVSAASVGVSPTVWLVVKDAPIKRGLQEHKVFGETPNTARETRALPRTV
jgi:hypothetical protein